MKPANRKKKLQSRIKDYDIMTSNTKKEYKGYKKPGSNKK